MSGSRNHILPKFLLKGFASRVKGKNFYSYQFPQNRPPFEANLINISVSKNFYGSKDETNVDDQITKMEEELSKIVHDLRQEKKDLKIEDERISYLITHLSVRTKFLRESFRSSSDYLLEIINNNFEEIIIKYFQKNPQKLIDRFDQEQELRKFSLYKINVIKQII